MDIERLEQRMALTVSTPTNFRWTPASDSGINKQDLVTNVTRPVFTGRADAGAKVLLDAGGRPLGTATANKNGIWTLATPPRAAFNADGVYTVTATAKNRLQEVSAPASFSFTIDRTRPRAQSIVYDQNTGSLTVSFSEAVAGVNLSRVRLRVPSFGTYPLNSNVVRSLSNGIIMSPASPGGTSYSFTPATKIFAPGTTFTVSIVAAGITDISGNRLFAEISRSFTI